MKDATYADSALSALRIDILQGRFRPGQPLKVLDLKARYGFGASPLREALSRLVGEGLVRLESNKGFKVAEFSASDLEDIAFMRTAIEVHAAKRALAVGGPDWEAGIVAALHKLVLATNSIQTDVACLDDWQRAHDEFHTALISACGSARVLGQQKLLTQQRDRYRRVLIGENFPRKLMIDDHRNLAEAALDRDSDHIVALLEGHFRVTSSFYQKTLQEYERNQGTPAASPLAPGAAANAAHTA